MTLGNPVAKKTFVFTGAFTHRKRSLSPSKIPRTRMKYGFKKSYGGFGTFVEFDR